MKLNDLNEASLGSALLTQVGKKLNPFNRTGQEKLSVKDRMIQQQFTEDLLAQAAESLAHGIQSGLVDPDPNAGMTQPEPVTPAAGKTPEQIRKEKQAAAAASAQKQMRPVPQQAPVATPAQVRQQKQAAAAAAAQKQMKPVAETKHAKLDAIFESIMNLNEAPQYAYTISSYLLNFLKEYLGGIDTAPLKQMADSVQATYAKDKGVKALQKLSSAAYSLYTVGGNGSSRGTQPTVATPVPGATQPAATPITQPIQPSSPEKVKTVYMQVKDLIKTLDKKGKQRILAALEKQLNQPTTTVPGSTAFNLMASQLTSSPTASSTGGATTTAPGVVRHAAGRGNKVKQVSKAVPKPTTVAESKHKIWGKK